LISAHQVWPPTADRAVQATTSGYAVDIVARNIAAESPSISSSTSARGWGRTAEKKPGGVHFASCPLSLVHPCRIARVFETRSQKKRHRHHRCALPVELQLQVRCQVASPWAARKLPPPLRNHFTTER